MALTASLLLETNFIYFIFQLLWKAVTYIPPDSGGFLLTVALVYWPLCMPCTLQAAFVSYEYPRFFMDLLNFFCWLQWWFLDDSRHLWYSFCPRPDRVLPKRTKHVPQRGLHGILGNLFANQRILLGSYLFVGIQFLVTSSPFYGFSRIKIRTPSQASRVGYIILVPLRVLRYASKGWVGKNMCLLFSRRIRTRL